MSDDRWRGTYDAWKTASPYDEWDGETEEGCACPLTLGAGGVCMTGKDCPIHGVDPDEEYERRRDDAADWPAELADWERDASGDES